MRWKFEVAKKDWGIYIEIKIRFASQNKSNNWFVFFILATLIPNLLWHLINENRRIGKYVHLLRWCFFNCWGNHGERSNSILLFLHSSQHTKHLIFKNYSLIIISLYYHGHIGAGWSCCGLATGTDVTYAINVIIRIKVAKITFIFNVSNDTESISSQQLIKHEEKFAYVRSSIKLTLFLSYDYHLQMLILFVQADTKKNIGDARVVIDYRMTFD